jgi:GAF domain-containing protein
MTGNAYAVGGDREVRRLETLYQLLAALSQASALEDVYEAAITSLLDATAADRAAILLFDDDGVMRFKASRGLSEEYREKVTGHSPWTRGMRNALPVIVPDALLDEDLTPFRETLRRERICALAFIPLALDAGVVGKFMLYYAAPHECTEDELEIAQAIAAHVALATERKRADLARARSEQRLQAILDNSPAVVFLNSKSFFRGTGKSCWVEQSRTFSRPNSRDSCSATISPSLPPASRFRLKKTCRNRTVFTLMCR